MKQDLLQKLGDKVVTKEQIFEAFESDFELLPILIGGVSSSKAVIRYGCAKILVDLSKQHPGELYQHMDFFISLLGSKYRILVWNALAAIANLCAVDSENKFDNNFDKYYSFLDDPYMVTVANVVGNSAKIALAKPYLIPRITRELLRIDKITLTPHLTEECKRVITEKAINCFDQLFDKMETEEKNRVISFAKKNAHSSRKSLMKEAALFLKRRNK